MLSSDELRRRYVDFFVRRGHTEISGGSLIPTDDDTVLFTTAGIQPLVPYFGGAPHPNGRRLTNVQRCLRTVDIDEVGDDTHLTAFEMLGNWSFGDYGKRESLAWTLELLTELGLEFDRLTFTIHPGDDEAHDRWVQLGVPPSRITSLEDNWWGPPGAHGPCGPDSEVFYDGVEIANNVFITHEQLPDGTIRPLPQRSVDVGMGLERILTAVQGVGNVYETDLFGLKDPSREERIVADHLRSAHWLLDAGVLPSNTGRGYVLRRLIRRAVRQGGELPTEHPVIRAEERRFRRTLERGLRELERIEHPTGRDLFRLFETYGFPPELAGLDGWEDEYALAAGEHRERSRAHT
jgi:alanyl-tRNA synthetase